MSWYWTVRIMVFGVVYATAEPVTDERFAEICDRPGILEGFENLKRKAPEHFGGNLLETDICDFALYAYRFPIDKDVRIHNIFVAGKEKMDFYVRNNPGPARVRYMDAPRYGTREPISEC